MRTGYSLRVGDLWPLVGSPGAAPLFGVGPGLLRVFGYPDRPCHRLVRIVLPGERLTVRVLIVPDGRSADVTVCLGSEAVLLTQWQRSCGGLRNWLVCPGLGHGGHRTGLAVTLYGGRWACPICHGLNRERRAAIVDLALLLDA